MEPIIKQGNVLDPLQIENTYSEKSLGKKN